MSPIGYFLAEDPGVAIAYTSSLYTSASAKGMTAYRVKSDKVADLTKAMNHLVEKTKIHDILQSWLKANPSNENEEPNWIYRELEDGTLYLYDQGQSWRRLIQHFEAEGYQHLRLKDLSEVSQILQPWRQEEPVIHVVFTADALEELPFSNEQKENWGLKKAA